MTPHQSPEPHITLRPISLVVALLAVACLALALTTWRLQCRVVVLVDRMSDLRMAEELGLDKNVDLLLVLAAEDASISLRNLKVVRQRAHTWLQTFCEEHAVDDDTQYLLRGALNHHITKYAGIKVEEEISDLAGPDLAERLHSNHQFNFRVVNSILGDELGDAYKTEVLANWDDWVSAL